MQLLSAAVRPGLEQGLLPAPVSLDQDAGAAWAQAGGLPTRLPVWQAGDIQALHFTSHLFTNFFWIAGLGELVDHLPQVRKSRFNDHNLGTSVQTWRKIYKIEQGGSFILFMEVTVSIRGSTDFIEITRKHVFCDMFLSDFVICSDLILWHVKSSHWALFKLFEQIPDTANLVDQ